MANVKTVLVDVTLKMSDGSTQTARSTVACGPEQDPILMAQAAADAAARVAIEKENRACPNHPSRPAASPSSNLCGPCLMGRTS